ncbi:hypothetical protein FE257_013044 [Aspergillus nanangensis]|uniref:DUF7587 domain-containing protein n=1 Tax=Aspergillus nanangensis TaxID=2582783 RepID=A0AAD4GQA8_ASPNN|nr:hypothetical protein FE257_013044 [Aspergillus nanangensis]
METPLLDKARALELLQVVHPFPEERDLSTHSWAKPPNPTYGGPLLRVWDRNSGSQPDTTDRMQARSPRLELGSRESRKTSLATHANYTLWNPTPFISFTASESGLQNFLSRRKGPSYPRKLTVINPNVRIAKGLPMIEMQSELRYYGREDPYRKGYSHYEDEYLCLWEVTPDEIVKHWDWDFLSENVHWYEDEVLPAFKEHNDRFLRRTTSEATFDMSTLHSALAGMLSVPVNNHGPYRLGLGQSGESDSLSNDDWNSSSEENDCNAEVYTYWDSDDEA